MPPHAEIEQIVRQVLQRLRDTDNQNNQTAETLNLTESVVAMATLKGRLEGVRQLGVSARAVVTPAAQDELRHRKITLSRCNIAKQGSETETLLWGVTIADGQQKIQQDWIDDENMTLLQLQEKRLPTLIERMAAEMKRNDRMGVLLTDRPAAALCSANRYRNVRAALGCSVEATREAVEVIGANLLIIDPRKKSSTELRGVTRQFISGGRRQCPTSWKSFLE